MKIMIWSRCLHKVPMSKYKVEAIIENIEKAIEESIKRDLYIVHHLDFVIFGIDYTFFQ